MDSVRKHPLYSTWVNMRQRCNNPKSTHYSYYGGRGIKVCERWDNFDLFVKDMGNKPTPSHTVDRIDGDKDYSPENCRWASKTEQMINTRTRSDNTSGFKGVVWRKNRDRWIAKVQRFGKIKTIGSYKTLEAAINARRSYNG